MPTTRDDQDVARAEALAAWLRAQPIGRAARAALLRDLALLAEAPASDGRPARLRGLDPAAFVAQLHRPDGGAVAAVPGIGPLRLAKLRRALPPAAAPAPPPQNASTGAASAPTPGPTEPPADTPCAPGDDTGTGRGDTLAALAAAVEGLLVPSESDFPLEPFRWEGAGRLTPEALLERLGLPPDTPVETRSSEAFFAPLARRADWMDAGQLAQADRFAALAALVAERLPDAVAYRAGQIRIAAVVVGQDRDGSAVGLRTTLIET